MCSIINGHEIYLLEEAVIKHAALFTRFLYGLAQQMALKEEPFDAGFPVRTHGLRAEFSCWPLRQGRDPEGRTGWTKPPEGQSPRTPASTRPRRQGLVPQPLTRPRQHLHMQIVLPGQLSRRPKKSDFRSPGGVSLISSY